MVCESKSSDVNECKGLLVRSKLDRDTQGAARKAE